MISLSLTRLAEIVGAPADGLPARDFDGLSINSRELAAGQLFVAIAGERHDGHDYVVAAAAAGAVAALVERRVDADLPQLIVDDCRAAMGRLANDWRRRSGATVIALTGSNGKTTVKEMLQRILSAAAPTLATRGNFNNDIGVPLTLFELAPEHRYAVIEMGANHRGEIARLAAIAAPDIVYVNNADAAHLEGFGDLQGVIEAKGELYAYCSPAHTAVFNLDEPACDYWQRHCAAGKRIGCALDRAADVTAAWRDAVDGLELEVTATGASHGCRLAVPGEHNARNALAAVALALAAGIGLEAAVASLDGFAGVEGRLRVLPGPGASRLLDDSYNANPGSLLAGVRVLCALPGRAWLALGDMAELGDDELELHCRAARAARELGVEKCFALGPLSCAASREFGGDGYCFDTVGDMAGALAGQLAEGVNLLIKGSRAAGMERLVALLGEARQTENVDAV